MNYIIRKTRYMYLGHICLSSLEYLKFILIRSPAWTDNCTTLRKSTEIEFLANIWFCHGSVCEDFDAGLFVKNVDNS